MAQNYTPENLAENFLICPYNPHHIIEPAKMPFHLTKCTKNMTKNKHLRCPFNGLHMIHENFMKDHIMNCPNRIMFEGYKFNLGESDPVIGADIPPVEIADPGETWEMNDDESYKPEKYMEENKGKVLIIPIGSTPSERRAFRQQQRINFSRHNRENKN